MKDAQHVYELGGRVLATLAFALLAWFAWTYLDVGVTFFGDVLPQKWLVIGFWHMVGLTLVLSLTIRVLGAFRKALR